MHLPCANMLSRETEMSTAQRTANRTRSLTEIILCPLAPPCGAAWMFLIGIPSEAHFKMPVSPYSNTPQF